MRRKQPGLQFHGRLRSGAAVAGFTLLEVMVALSVISIAFLALAMSQVSNLRATVRTQNLTELKTAANQVLEERMSQVLTSEDVSTADHSYFDSQDVYTDSYGSSQTRYLSFYFIDYYYSCPDLVTAPRSVRAVACSGDTDRGDGVTVDWALIGRSGVEGEGLLDVIVTARHESGSSLTIGDVITCYEIYPSPSSEAPVPCPEPDLYGGGR